MQHAIIKLGDYNIPLIGVPPNSIEERCDKCKQIFPLLEIALELKSFLCFNCKNESICSDSQ